MIKKLSRKIMKKNIIRIAIAITITCLALPSFAIENEKAPLITPGTTTELVAEIQNKAEKGEITTNTEAPQQGECAKLWRWGTGLVCTGLLVGSAVVGPIVGYFNMDHSACARVCAAIQCANFTPNAEGHPQYYVPVLTRDAKDHSLFIETFDLRACETYHYKCHSLDGSDDVPDNRYNAYTRIFEDQPICEEGVVINNNPVGTTGTKTESYITLMLTTPNPDATDDRVPNLQAFEKVLSLK
jgi:hypothetical protein